MIKDRIYRISKYSVFLALMIIFGIGIVKMDSSYKSPFIENPSTMRIIAILVLLLGINMLFFRKRWIEDDKSYRTKFLQNKPKIIQKLLGHGYKDSWQNRVIIPVIGIFAIIWAIILFMASFNR